MSLILPTPFPLCWPDHIPRSERREAGSFKTNLPRALDNVDASVRAFARDSRKTVDGLVLSSNVALGKDRPEDPGVATWFTWDGTSVCIPVDRYTTPAANLQAIHHIIEARRVELRHGTLALVRASLHGLIALPSPPRTPWWEVLHVERTAPAAGVEEAFKRLARERHPDQPGGSADAMAELNRARQDALQAITARGRG